MALWKDILERSSRLEPGDMSSSVSSANYPLMLFVLPHRVEQSDVRFLEMGV